MIIILPNDVTGQKDLEEKFHQLNLKESLREIKPRRINLSLPKFRIGSTTHPTGASKEVTYRNINVYINTYALIYKVYPFRRFDDTSSTSTSSSLLSLSFAVID